MRVKESPENLMIAARSAEYCVELGPSVSPYFHSGYQGLPGIEVHPDVLTQLKANLARLEDLHGRLHFTVAEVKSLVARSS